MYPSKGIVSKCKTQTFSITWSFPIIIPLDILFHKSVHFLLQNFDFLSRWWLLWIYISKVILCKLFAGEVFQNNSLNIPWLVTLHLFTFVNDIWSTNILSVLEAFRLCFVSVLSNIIWKLALFTLFWSRVVFWLNGRRTRK